MFTHKDIEHKHIFILHSNSVYSLKVSQGRLTVEDSENQKIITHLPFPKILAIFIVGHTKITTPFIDHCTKNAIPLIVVHSNFRPIFFYFTTSEANFLLRQKQYTYSDNNIQISQHLIYNKISNQISLLKKTRQKNDKITSAISNINALQENIFKTQSIQCESGVEYK